MTMAYPESDFRVHARPARPTRVVGSGERASHITLSHDLHRDLGYRKLDPSWERFAAKAIEGVGIQAQVAPPEARSDVKKEIYAAFAAIFEHAPGLFAWIGGCFAFCSATFIVYAGLLYIAAGIVALDKLVLAGVTGLVAAGFISFWTQLSAIRA